MTSKAEVDFIDQPLSADPELAASVKARGEGRKLETAFRSIHDDGGHRTRSTPSLLSHLSTTAKTRDGHPPGTTVGRPRVTDFPPFLHLPS